MNRIEDGAYELAVDMCEVRREAGGHPAPPLRPRPPSASADPECLPCPPCWRQALGVLEALAADARARAETERRATGWTH